MSMINMFELTKIHKRRQQGKIKIYDEILADCHKKIYNVVKMNDKDECIFKVPSYKFGLPTFNRDACTAHILIKLRNNGFDAKYVPPDKIHISWKKQKQTYFYDPNVLMIENNPQKSKEILQKLNKNRSESSESSGFNTKLLYRNTQNRRNEDFIEQPPQVSQGVGNTDYVTKHYRELNEKYLTS